jgi:nitrogen fixation protein NifU and related proteins
MSDLRELYQEVLLDHNRRPRNFQKLEGADRKAEGYNPLCGDQVTVYLKLDGDVIREITFQGSGCAISKSSASMMTMSLKGKTRGEAEALFQRFHQMLTGDPGKREVPDGLGKLTVFSGVCEFPIRVKCATLPWHTMHAALEGKAERISTE